MTRVRHDRVVPDQHGAWGFLVLPIVLGAAAGGWSWASVPVATAWVLCYPFSWALLGRLTAPRRRERFDRALVVWGTAAAPFVVLSVVLAPWLCWVGLAVAPLFATNLVFARQRRERHLVNDLVLVLECVLVVPVIAALGAGKRGWRLPAEVLDRQAVQLAVVMCAVTLLGSTLHVKSLIRERNDLRYARAARTFAVLSVLALAAWVVLSGRNAWLAAPFALLAVRATVLRNPGWGPVRIGLVELSGLVCVAAVALLCLR